jgi:hypothetical protein
MTGRCVESLIRNVSYDVVGHPRGKTEICMQANPPEGCSQRTVRNLQRCDGVSGRCTIDLAWAEDFGGNGQLGPDPCRFIVKQILNVKYTCSHNGDSKTAQLERRPYTTDCSAASLGTATLNCP